MKNNTVEVVLPKIVVVPCAGFVVLSKDATKVVIVATHSGNNLGFPKGKRKKDESYKETALRELEEETGLSADQIDIVENVYFDEMSVRNNPATRYFVAYAKKSDVTFVFDEEELEKVCWMDCDKLFELNNFKDSRKSILIQILSTLKNNEVLVCSE